MRIIWVLLLGLAIGFGQSGAGLAAGPERSNLEELQYRLSLGFWQDVARVHLRLTKVGPDRYRAEFAGAAQGAWKLLRRWLPERYQTEMALDAGRLKPLVYREEFQAKGQHITKEYRFNYSQGVLEVWRGVDHRKPVQDWQAPLGEPLYDPLTLIYNLRLGAMGPLTPGQTLRVAMIPNPEPREMILNIGPDTAQGRKVMLTMKSKNAGDEEGPYFIFSNHQWVPLEAWIRVLEFGKLSGQLLNPWAVMKEGLPAPPATVVRAGESR